MDPLFFSLAGNIVAVVLVPWLAMKLFDARMDRLENPKLVAENLRLTAERDKAAGAYRELQKAVRAMPVAVPAKQRPPRQPKARKPARVKANGVPA